MREFPDLSQHPQWPKIGAYYRNTTSNRVIRITKIRPGKAWYRGTKGHDFVSIRAFLLADPMWVETAPPS